MVDKSVVGGYFMKRYLELGMFKRIWKCNSACVGLFVVLIYWQSTRFSFAGCIITYLTRISSTHHLQRIFAYLSYA